MCHEHTLIEGLRAITRYVQTLQVWDIAVKVSQREWERWNVIKTMTMGKRERV